MSVVEHCSLYLFALLRIAVYVCIFSMSATSLYVLKKKIKQFDLDNDANLMF